MCRVVLKCRSNLNSAAGMQVLGTIDDEYLQEHCIIFHNIGNDSTKFGTIQYFTPLNISKSKLIDVRVNVGDDIMPE
jgi:dUTPase